VIWDGTTYEQWVLYISKTKKMKMEIL